VSYIIVSTNAKNKGHTLFVVSMVLSTLIVMQLTVAWDARRKIRKRRKKRREEYIYIVSEKLGIHGMASVCQR
tara:strand:- start:341 stop:559 length:219 start_codon:yes stop_codon:yes gene_type:complete